MGAAPWSTAKFDAVEKKLLSPRESDKPTADLLRKTTAPYIPVVDSQRSFSRPKSDEFAAPAVD